MRRDDPDPRRLILSAAAWLKWQYLCHAGPTEAAAFGLSAEGDPLSLDDLLVVRQRTTVATTSFDDAAVADLFDELVDAGYPPAQFARVWLHTHPGSSPEPSRTDEATFARAFGRCDWAVMAILGRTGRTYARLHFAAGPGGSVELPVAVDWSTWPDVATDPKWPLAERVADWRREYETLVVPLGDLTLPAAGRPGPEPGWFPDDPLFYGGRDGYD
jgi:proteasome lid subunit RPN8/RPN11